MTEPAKKGGRRAHLDDHRLLTDRQLAERWAVSPKTLTNWRCSGHDLPFIKVGAKVRYRLDEVLRYEKQNTVPATPIKI